MKSGFKRIERPQSIHLSVQEAIRDNIVERGLQPGDPMNPETELARQLGVSRNSVREAVKALESMGIVESRRGSGLYVGTFSWDPLLENLGYGLMQNLRELAELLEIRQVLELGMLPDALRLVDEQQLTELKALLDAMSEQAERGEIFAEQDREFHRTLFRNLNNATFLKLLDIFWLAFRKAAEHEDLLDDNPMRTYYAHRRIVEGVKQRDLAQTSQALKDHYQAISTRVNLNLDV